ncbi:hypothetical protein Rcae01_05695 [Novipirellula caenicola]|uniref:Uncharacterized protein n=1 Tax=Novipirellula caenicola TaxID=1536901 RepID=A0ABP9VYI1_9BACT
MPFGEVRVGGSRLWVGLGVLEVDRASMVSPPSPAAIAADPPGGGSSSILVAHIWFQL